MWINVHMLQDSRLGPVATLVPKITHGGSISTILLANSVLSINP